MSPDETSILVDPDQRIIKQVTVEDVAAANKLFDDLMGTQIIPRKDLFSNIHRRQLIMCNFCNNIINEEDYRERRIHTIG